MTINADELPPVVYDDPVIDVINNIVWRLKVPEMSEAIDLLQYAAVAIERTRMEEDHDHQR